MKICTVCRCRIWKPGQHLWKVRGFDGSLEDDTSPHNLLLFLIWLVYWRYDCHWPGKKISYQSNFPIWSSYNADTLEIIAKKHKNVCRIIFQTGGSCFLKSSRRLRPTKSFKGQTIVDTELSFLVKPEALDRLEERYEEMNPTITDVLKNLVITQEELENAVGTVGTAWTPYYR